MHLVDVLERHHVQKIRQQARPVRTKDEDERQAHPSPGYMRACHVYIDKTALEWIVSSCPNGSLETGQYSPLRP